MNSWEYNSAIYTLVEEHWLVQLLFKTIYQFCRDKLVYVHPSEINTKAQKEMFKNKHSSITCDSKKLETIQISIDTSAIK